MKIALVTESFLPTINGVTNSVLRVAEHLATTGHEALIIAPECADGPSHYAGFRIKRVPSLNMRGIIPVGLPQRALEPLLEGFRPHVIHLASPIFLGSYVAKIAKRIEIPTLSIYQTDIAGFARHYGLTIAHSQLKRWIAKIHSQTDRTLAPSTWACADLEKSGVSNVHLWQRGVDTNRFNPEMSDDLFRDSVLKKQSGKLLIGYVGRLANEKRVEDLRILDRQNDIQLVIVGDGPARSRLERALPNAHFVGFQNGAELAKMYASFDLFVHTGKHETFCQSIQESLSSGTPVIAPNSGGPIDLVKHETTGYLIDTGEPELLLRTVTEFRHRPDRKAMSFAARESVLERTWARVNQQLLRHYEDLALLKTSPKDMQRFVA